jgi:phosphoglycolate phosphatase-like HAD superfamily hydrolase
LKLVEVIRPLRADAAKVALFDFDGTLSLVRSGWVDVMAPMMVEALLETQSGESEEQLRAVANDFIARLTGKQTIYQMIELADQVKRRGGAPEDPLVYKYRYLDRLNERIKDRLEELRGGGCSPDKYLVPGSRALLEDLRARGLTLVLASGTDEPFVKDEARLLDVERYFNGGVFGAQDDYKSFSKAIVIQRIIREAGVRGEEFLAFGDGYVEIENVKQVGGVAVGAATDEPACQSIDDWKRQRLIGVGADYIVPHYEGWPELAGLLFSK